jgi:glyoxylase-like metal-dependent hydrolase (beta-lactamase superfamily II)
MKVAPNIHHFDTGPFNWYLIEQAGRLTLVDAGFPGHYTVFLKGIASLGMQIKDVEAIVLTHAHADHIGFAERVRKESGASVFVHTKDAQMAQRPLQLPWWGLLSNAWRPYTATMLGVATLNGVFSLPRLSVVKTIEDGQVLDIPGKPMVLHTPGHTEGEIVLLFENDRSLISGDTLVTRNLLTGELGQPQLTNPILNANFRKAKRSLDLIRELGELTMLPGHGKPWSGNMADAVELALQNEKKD